MKKIDVAAHRGASAEAPENTLPAIELAVSSGADLVEIDIQRTLDGEFVVIHDAALTRTTNAEGAFPGRARYDVAGFTLAEIRTLDAGSWFGAGFAGTPVPTLREVLAALAGRSGLLLEIKNPGAAPGTAAAVAGVLASAGWLGGSPAGRLIVQSSDWDLMAEFHRLAPEVPIGLLGGPPTPQQLAEVSGWAHAINPKHTRVTADLVRGIHRHGMVIWPYTVDSPKRMGELVALGVDGIITNRPALLGEVLAAGPQRRTFRQVFGLQWFSRASR